MMGFIVKTLHLQRNYSKICCLGVNPPELPNTFIIFCVTVFVNKICYKLYIELSMRPLGQFLSHYGLVFIKPLLSLQLANSQGWPLKFIMFLVTRQVHSEDTRSTELCYLLHCRTNIRKFSTCLFPQFFNY